jgi:hypothetical protein
MLLRHHTWSTPECISALAVGATQVLSGLGGVSHARPIGPQLRMGGPGFPVVASLVVGGPTRSR